MTKTFCDKCGAEASGPYLDVSIKLKERTKFQLRAIFEIVEEPAPCGSLGLSHERIKSADICRACQFELVKALEIKVQNSVVKP